MHTRLMENATPDDLDGALGALLSAHLRYKDAQVFTNEDGRHDTPGIAEASKHKDAAERRARATGATGDMIAACLNF